MTTKVQLDGFASIAEARSAVLDFLRETKPAKKNSSRLTYATSYEHMPKRSIARRSR